MKILTMFLGLALSTSSFAAAMNDSKYVYEMGTKSRFVLLRGITVPPHSRPAMLQKDEKTGTIEMVDQIDVYKPYCKLLFADSDTDDLVNVGDVLAPKVVSAGVDDYYYSGDVYLSMVYSAPIVAIACSGENGLGDMTIGQLKALLKGHIEVRADSANEKKAVPRIKPAALGS